MGHLLLGNDDPKLNEKYGISIQALTYRAKDIGILSESAYEVMFINFRSKGISAVEPGCWAYPEEPRLTKQYLFRAVAEGRISEATALKLYPDYLGEIMEMESQVQSVLYKFLALSSEDRNKYLMAASESAAGLYEDGGMLADSEIIDDVEEYE